MAEEGKPYISWKRCLSIAFLRLHLAALSPIFNFFWRSVDLKINVFYQDAGISQDIDTRLSLKINEYVEKVKNV